MSVQHVYIIGSKSIGQYGGFESFVMNLLKAHEHDDRIQYHVACKANGSGFMDTDRLPGAQDAGEGEFNFCGAHCFMIRIPEYMGSAQAIYYDLKALKYVCSHIRANNISHPVVYILASRIGPFEKKYVKLIHQAGGKVYQNPDGHEDWRGKWNPLIRRYWKLSEKYAVKNADVVICDSKNIEEYIKTEYKSFDPDTVYIAYGTDVAACETVSDTSEAAIREVSGTSLSDKDGSVSDRYAKWLREHDLTDGEFYISVGRFVPENNFETMIREFMASRTGRDFAIITTQDNAYASRLQKQLDYRSDHRIKFVGTVYDHELLAMIRFRAYGYIHGHEVGGTNPSLLESMATTKVNLLYDVGFNREVAEDTALYWNKEPGNLATLIGHCDAMGEDDREELGRKAKLRMGKYYNWEYISGRYAEVFLAGID